MEKTEKYCYRFCLLISLAINIVQFGTNHLYYVGGCNYRPLTWSEKAAAEAEEVAAISCSDHGRAYVDGIVSANGQPVCECHDCYGGDDCSELSPGCAANAESGDPMFLEPFWMEHASDSATVISGWHRMSYQFDNDNIFMSKQLETYIRKMHSLVGNAVTQGRYLVFGIGATQLLNAAVYALSSADNSSPPSNVLASIPFYPIYKGQTEFFNSENFQFEGDANSWRSNNNNSTINNMDVIEFVTSPNNPGGELKTPVVLGGKTIYDHAYFWPHYTPITAPSDHDLMIFTLSKFTGHAGTRFGWAIIKDKDIFDKVSNYISIAEYGIPKDTQLRVLKILKVAVEGDGKPLFRFSYQKMRDRWDRLTSVMSKSTRLSVQKRHPLHCNFFNETRLSTPAYAWVKCEREEDYDCGVVLEAGKIIGQTGMTFSVEDRYTRLSLIKSQDDFELLLQRLVELVSLENGSVVQNVTAGSKFHEEI